MAFGDTVYIRPQQLPSMEIATHVIVTDGTRCLLLPPFDFWPMLPRLFPQEACSSSIILPVCFNIHQPADIACLTVLYSSYESRSDTQRMAGLQARVHVRFSFDRTPLQRMMSALVAAGTSTPFFMMPPPRSTPGASVDTLPSEEDLLDDDGPATTPAQPLSAVRMEEVKQVAQVQPSIQST